MTEVLRPRLDADGYRGLKLTGADSNTDWNIAPVVKGDRRLRGALYAISAHYHEDTPDSARNCGLPIFNSEDLAPYRHHFSCALDMAHKIIQSYASGRMVQYQMHPVIEAIYDSTPYSCKKHPNGGATVVWALQGGTRIVGNGPIHPVHAAWMAISG